LWTQLFGDGVEQHDAAIGSNVCLIPGVVSDDIEQKVVHHVWHALKSIEPKSGG
jgi:hypothetical protein